MTRQKLLSSLRKYSNSHCTTILSEINRQCKDTQQYLDIVLQSGSFYYAKGKGICSKVSDKLITHFSTKELLKLL